MSPKHMKPWSPAEVRRMRQMARAGHTSTAAAKALQRTPGATRYAAMARGISFRSMGRKFSAMQSARWA